MTINNYSEEFKKNAVQQLLLPGTAGLTATARKLDISSSTLFYWREKYANYSSMKKSKEVKNWTSEKKLDAVIKTAAMTEEDLGKFLRANGLHSSDLESFKKELIAAIPSRGRPRLDPEVIELRKEVKALSSDLKRKDAALAEYSARVILLKKSHEIWGTKEDDE